MRESERIVFKAIDELMYHKRYIEANERLENVRDTIPRVYYRIYKRRILKETEAERGKK